jgi:hypothetical protein
VFVVAGRLDGVTQGTAHSLAETGGAQRAIRLQMTLGLQEEKRKMADRNAKGARDLGQNKGQKGLVRNAGTSKPTERGTSLTRTLREEL